MDKEVIEAFLQEMRQRHGREIDAIALPEGTADYLLDRMQASDVETLTFMLKLSYLMGLQTGYAVQGAEGGTPPPSKGPLQA